MEWSRETGALRLTGLDVRMLTREPEGSALVAQLLRGDYPATLPVPLLTQRMLPLLLWRHRAYRSYLLDYWQLLHMSGHPSAYYYKRTVPKRDGGGERTVYLVDPRLKDVQQWILHQVLEYLPVDAHACAYRPGVTLLDNARPHAGHRVLVKLDIRDFFGATRYPAVFAVFRDAGYSVPVATLLANLCCLEGALPQGSAASPALSNLCFRRCDGRIAAYCDERGITYTRYSDDMSFSGDFDPYALIASLRKLLAAYGYVMHEEKTRIFRQGQRQSVTGVVVNEKPQAAKTYRKRLRQEFYYVEKHGLLGHYLHVAADAPERSVWGLRHYAAGLGGRLGFALFLNPEDRELREYERVFRQQQEAAESALDAGRWLCTLDVGAIVLPPALQLEFAGRDLFWRYRVESRRLCLELCPLTVARTDPGGRITVAADGRLELPDVFTAISVSQNVLLQAESSGAAEGFRISFPAPEDADETRA